MDRSRGHQFRHIQYKVRCLVLWDPPNRSGHLWKNTLPRYSANYITIHLLYCIETNVELLFCRAKNTITKNLLKSHAGCFFSPNQGWPIRRWSGTWTNRTGCRVRKAAHRNSMTLWWCVGGRSLRNGQLLNFCRTLSMTFLSPRRDNMRCSRDYRKKKNFLLRTKIQQQKKVLKREVRLQWIEVQPNIFFVTDTIYFFKQSKWTHFLQLPEWM